MSAKFYDQGVTANLQNKRKLSAFLDDLVSGHLETVTKVQLTYIFCNDDELHTINKQFLDHDTFTDIITFNLSENDTTLQGEIYISIDRVKDNAAKFNTTYQNELHRVIFHGALHLCGYKDKQKNEQEEMRSQEDACLKAYLKD